MKKWEIISKFRIQNSEFRIEDIIDIILDNRGIKTKKEREEFLHPQLEAVTPKTVGIDLVELEKAIKRIQNAIERKEQIVVFGDYDVDGICGAAILWETLHSLGAKALPYIPHRIDEGYGLSIKGVENVINVMPDLIRHQRDSGSKAAVTKKKNGGLIITVDNGIVAHEAVDFANKQGIDVIITDHHVVGKKLPKAHAIVHTTKLCGTGVAWALAQELKVKNEKFKVSREDNHLELVAFATVADLVPLTGANRTLLKFGLEALHKTKRIGLLELFKEAALDKTTIGTYEIGHIIAPRLNAMGRLEYAMDSLRLLCTKDKIRAARLALLLGKTNRERQLMTEETVIHAKTFVANAKLHDKKLLFVSHKTYQQGVIGLVAGKLVEEFYRPAIVLSIGETHTKASARSIKGFNIIEFINSASAHLVNAGGHPMAAGFTVETTKLAILQEFFETSIQRALDDDLLTRTLRIDVELAFSCIDTSLHEGIQKLAPFGMGNPEPTFVTRSVVVEDSRLIGREKTHVKLALSQTTNDERRTVNHFNAVAFGLGNRINELKPGSTLDVVYTIDENEWQGRKSLQLKIKDFNSA